MITMRGAFTPVFVASLVFSSGLQAATAAPSPRGSTTPDDLSFVPLKTAPDLSSVELGKSVSPAAGLSPDADHSISPRIMVHGRDAFDFYNVTKPDFKNPFAAIMLINPSEKGGFCRVDTKVQKRMIPFITARSLHYDVNERTEFNQTDDAPGFTPLMIAAQLGLEECVKALLVCDADPRITVDGYYGRATALDLAKGELEYHAKIMTEVTGLSRQAQKKFYDAYAYCV